MVANFLNIDAKDVISWVRDNTPKRAKLCVPFSGGVDSATCLALASEAVGSKKVIALHIGHSSPRAEGEEVARSIANLLGVKLLNVNLRSLYNEFCKVVDYPLENKRLDEESDRMTATRSSVLVYTFAREVARENNALVVGTLDLAEILVGFYPKESFYGDYLPIGGMFRKEVRDLASKLGLPLLPESFSVSDGCGQISNFVKDKTAGRVELSEEKLDRQLLRMISGESTKTVLFDYCRGSIHKALSCVAGRSIYFPSDQRRTFLKRWLYGNLPSGVTLLN